MCMNQSHRLCLWKQGSLCHCLLPKSREWNPISGPHREAFVSQILKGGIIRMEPDFSPPSPPLFVFFWALFPLSPSPIVWVHVWLVFLGTPPSSVQLCLLFVLTARRSVADTLWSASGTGDPTELFFSHMEGSAHCAHRRQSRTPRHILSESLHSVSSQ